ncbi:urate hydroxylase PuuD, partial [Colwellia sp. BRX8-8]|nr:urate hydroxylase PuuD [Colwellia sp. BRX8-8]
VFFVIIPGQKKMVERLIAGEKVDAAPGIAGKQRSVHNTYFTLPVVFVMISNHYAMTYNHEYNWLILMGISMAGALIRVFFVSRHTPGKPLTGALVTAVVIMVVVIWAMAPKSIVANTDSTASPVEFSQVQAIIKQRCSSCHADKPTQAGFAAAPKGFIYDTPEQIKAQATQIYQQAVVLKAMPIGNLTKITDSERKLIALWYQQRQTTKE